MPPIAVQNPRLHRPKLVTCDTLPARFPLMSRSPLRPTTAPHTNKPPGACPYCGSHSITRKGVRKKKLEIVQLWRCGSCKRLFTPGPAALRNKTYPIRLMLQALTLYNLGYSLSETAKRLKSKAGRTVSPNTIATWIGAHKEQTTFRRLRAEAKTIYPPAQTIRSIKLYHPKSTPSPITARSSHYYAAIRNISALKRSRLFLSRFRARVRTSCFAATTIRRPAPRKRSQRLPTSIASSSIAKRTRLPRLRR